MQYLISFLVFFIVLLLLVLIHEAGHFFAAKFFKVRVDEFGFGLPPRLWGKKFGETIYSINWLPFGGFVKLLGEDEGNPDEIHDKKRSFAHQPGYVRATIAAAGVVMNFVLTLIIFTIIYTIGGPIDNGKVLVGIVTPGSSAEKAGLKDGDVVTQINGTKLGGLKDFEDRISKGKEYTFTIERNNQTQQLRVPQLNQTVVYLMDVEPNTPAATAGLQKGDVVTAVNGEKLKGTTDFREKIKQNAGKEMKLTIRRGNEALEKSLTPRKNPPANQGPVGVAISAEIAVAQHIDRVAFPLWQAPVVGLQQAVDLTGKTFQALGGAIRTLVAEQRAPEDLGGATRIVYFTHQAVKVGPEAVLMLTGLLSLNLAILNVLPIPALDGGRLFFVLLETITRRKVSPNVEKWIHTTGFAVLLLLIVLVTFNDIFWLLSNTAIGAQIKNFFVR